MPKNAAVIVAAGRGSRMGGQDGPKQYRMLSGQPLLQHTVNTFLSCQDISRVQVVIHQDDEALYAQSVKPHSKLAKPVIGGATRQASCKAGVDAVLGFEKVLIHDAARPFVSAATIRNVLSSTNNGVCALPARPIADTVKRSGKNGEVSETIPRDGLHLAQTPQGFMQKDIAEAHARAASETNDEFTDDAAVAEWAGMKVLLVEGNRQNFKITTSDDMEEARRMLAAQMIPDVRTGNGYDVHTLGPGDHVILCGVTIPHDKSLQGHSDADVGFHALTDALLGTIGEGDIGSHFPPSDPQWKGASSDRFITHAIDLVRSKGGVVTNLDITIICEAPKIGPHRDAMRKSVSKICDVSIDRISVKATTNERMGFVGREEGIAAIATATVVFGDV